MSTTIRLNAVRSALVHHTSPETYTWKDATTVKPSTNNDPYYGKDSLLVRFENLPQGYELRAFERGYYYIHANVSFKPTTSYTSDGEARFCWDQLSENYAYDSQPPKPFHQYGYGDVNAYKILNRSVSSFSGYVTASSTRLGAFDSAIKYGVACGFDDDFHITWNSVSAFGSSDPPYMEIIVDDEDAYLEVTALSPAGGYLNEKKSSRFSWTAKINKTPLDASSLYENCVAVFEWRTAEGAAINSISAPDVYSITVPANTFPSTGVFQARVKFTDGSGHVSYSEWSSFSTTDATPTATALSPINNIVSREPETLFRWSHSISTGSAQSRADIQYSVSGSWVDYATITGSAREAKLSTEQFSAGTVYWRVRTYNDDGIAGAWSEPVSFFVVAAPITPSVSTDGKPIATVSWQTDKQQAFQLTVGDVFNSDTRFGTDKTFRLPVILPDGDYMVRVRVQNDLGLWSEWGEAPLRVRNVPGAEINLGVQVFDCDAELIWSSTDSYERFVVYRNGIPVAVVNDNRYADPMAHGDTTWSVAGILAGSGYYTMSNAVTETLSVSGVAIRDFEGGEWLHLEKTQNQYAEKVFTFQRNVAYRHFAGAALPVAELGEDCERTVSFAAALSDRADVAALLALQGKQIICKTGEELAVGILDKVTRTRGLFFDNFEITLRSIHYEEAAQV